MLSFFSRSFVCYLSAHVTSGVTLAFAKPAADDNQSGDAPGSLSGNQAPGTIDYDAFPSYAASSPGSDLNFSSPYLSDFGALEFLDGDRTEDEIRQVCKAAEFELTVFNWYDARVPEFLAEFSRENREMVERRGIVGAIAFKHLADSGFQCGIGSSSLCTVKCTEVVRTINDLGEARRVLFALKSAQHLSSVFSSINDLFAVAQSNVLGMVPKMASTFFWAEESDAEKNFQYVMGYLNVFFQLVLMTAGSWSNFDDLIKQASTGVKNAVVASKKAEVALQQANGGYLSRFFRSNVDTSALQLEANIAAATVTTREGTLRMLQGLKEQHGNLNEQKWFGLMSTWLGLYVPELSFGTVSRFGKWEGSETAPYKNNAELQYQLQQTMESVRRNLHRTVDTIFGPSTVGSDGSNAFTLLVSLGSYLPPNAEAMAKWTGPEAEMNLSRHVLLYAMNSALKAQSIWISCTDQYRKPVDRASVYSDPKEVAETCTADRSGPQDMKACVNGLACYLYKWNARGSAHAHQVERPFGLDEMGEKPWSISPRDIITSSVLTHLGFRGNNNATGLDLQVLRDATSADRLWDASFPGAFTIPVCVSHYNWAAPVEPVTDVNCDTDPHCRKKRLPCYCGPWGRDTRQVWEETRLWDAQDSPGEYRKLLCPRQINRIIPDELERWVALCRLNVRETGVNGFIKKTGKHKLCDAVIEALEQEGYPEVDVIGKAFKTRLMCQAGVIGERECRGFLALGGGA